MAGKFMSFTAFTGETKRDGRHEMVSSAAKEGDNALDHFRHFAGSMVARSGELLHFGRIHPPATGAGRDRSADQSGERPERCRLM